MIASVLPKSQRRNGMMDDEGKSDLGGQLHLDANDTKHLTLVLKIRMNNNQTDVEEEDSFRLLLRAQRLVGNGRLIASNVLRMLHHSGSCRCTSRQSARELKYGWEVGFLALP